ncbi:ABC transporter ATP-binding protein [Corticibacter populi]|uniref:ABC transporter ATP-binding protein n=1 Tax=Corticibacter populi TaxID=1550736 RepID=A0A3M6QVJ1_9BURK|nr:ABC transporter ATP-binding protein [Corticibacter populi]RMX06512.1 ABC transporter ATP-binding protein [Corticibacter populi]RZS31927.1 NitT/TauT family transport system ATP-binding protein [Corticibacter populi]
MSDFIQIQGLSKRFEVPGRGAHLALDGIDMGVREGEFVSLLGPSGCGKSTLLYMVGGFVKPSQGQILVDGRAVQGPAPERGPVFQEFALFPWKTVLHNVMYGLRVQKVPAAQARERAEVLLEMVGLSDYAGFYPRQLSGGMRQRVAIARTLAYQPRILLMDEPFGALDAHTRTNLQNELLGIWERDRKTVLFVTHGVDEAVYLSDRVFVLSGSPGRLHRIVDIDLPRPRIRAELLTNLRYQQYVLELENMLDHARHVRSAA